MDFTNYIEINPDVRFGKPVIKGTRISVYDVRDLISSGMSVNDIMVDFPELNELQIQACLNYPAK